MLLKERSSSKIILALERLKRTFTIYSHLAEYKECFHVLRFSKEPISLELCFKNPKVKNLHFKKCSSMKNCFKASKMKLFSNIFGLLRVTRILITIPN